MSIADFLLGFSSSLRRILARCNTNLVGKGVTAASSLTEVPDKIASIVTGEGLDTSDATATASDIAAGKTAYANGSKVTGTSAARTAANVTASGATVSIPAGMYSAAVQKSVQTAQAATPSVSADLSTGIVTAESVQSEGYVTSGTKRATLSLPTKASETITPGTTAKIISGGKFLIGPLTIAGSSYLAPENIKSGISIFGVEGNYSGGTGSAALRNESRNVSYYGSVSSNQVTARFTESNVIGVVLHHSKSWPSIVQVDPIDTYIAMPGTDGTMKVLAVTRDGKSSGVIDGTSLVSIGNGQFVLNTIPSTYLADANFDTQADAYSYTLITA